MWFERNRNAVFDEREWPLPRVTVTLTRAVAVAADTDGRVVAFALPGTMTTVTEADGSYVFSHLPPGAYRVEASARIEGFDHTSDSDGDLDRVVDVGVDADTTGIADFAGLGRGVVEGTIFEASTNTRLASAAVTCRWGGYDDELGTADDVRFEVVASDEGTSELEGVPYGTFTCSDVDRGGRESAAAAVDVFSPEPVEAPLPVATAALPTPYLAAPDPHLAAPGPAVAGPSPGPGVAAGVPHARYRRTGWPPPAAM